MLRTTITITVKFYFITEKEKTKQLIITRFYYSRTPGSRQPSPAEESLSRPPTLLDPQSHVGSVFPQHPLHHMLGSSMDQQGSAPQLNSYHHQLPPMNQLQPQVLNGVGGIQVAQV